MHPFPSDIQRAILVLALLLLLAPPSRAQGPLPPSVSFDHDNLIVPALVHEGVLILSPDQENVMLARQSLGGAHGGPAAADQTLLGLFPKHVRDGLFLHAMLGGSFVLHGIDIAQSMYLIGRYPKLFSEANPLLRPFQDHPTAFGAVKMSFAVGVNGAIWSLHKDRPTLSLLMLVVNNGLMVYVDHRNAQTGRTVGIR